MQANVNYSREVFKTNSKSKCQVQVQSIIPYISYTFLNFKTMNYLNTPLTPLKGGILYLKYCNFYLEFSYRHPNTEYRVFFTLQSLKNLISKIIPQRKAGIDGGLWKSSGNRELRKGVVVEEQGI